MSFEPTIIINKKDLSKQYTAIESKRYTDKNEERRKAYDVLGKACSQEPLKLGKLEFVIMRPEGTMHNEQVRQLLTKLKIEYTIDI